MLSELEQRVEEEAKKSSVFTKTWGYDIFPKQFVPELGFEVPDAIFKMFGIPAMSLNEVRAKYAGQIVEMEEIVHRDLFGDEVTNRQLALIDNDAELPVTFSVEMPKLEQGEQDD